MKDIELIHGDSLQALKGYGDNHFDVAIIDPPYGIKMDGRGMPSKAGLAKQKNGNKLSVKRNNYKGKEWDNKSPDKCFFDEVMRVSKNQIIWGANHFISKIPYDSSCWIVWDKVNGTTNQSDCELAWTSFSTAVRQYEFMWSGMCQGSNENGRVMQGNKKLNEKRIHPTQKPVKLYKWILENYTSEGDLILDTHLGSGSIAIACHQMQRKLIGYEIDAEYYEKAFKRFKEQTAQQALW